MTNVAILRELVFISSEKKLLIEFDNLIQFLTKNRKDGDSDVKKFNIKRQLKTKNAIIEDNGCLFIPFESLIRFISDNYENYKVCRTTFDEIIEKLLVPNEVNSDKSTFTLYKEISKSNFLKHFEPCLLQIDIKENDLYTLKTNQKHEFSEVEWMKICLFEHHWQENNDSSLDYENVLQSKFMYWENLQKTKQGCKDLLGACLKNINLNCDRKKAYDELMKESFEYDGTNHSYVRLDKSINTVIQDLVPTENEFSIATVDCLPSVCQHDYGVHLFVEKGNLNHDEICTIIRREFENQHSLYIPEIIFLSPGTLQRYSCKNCETSSCHRFHLRDEYFTRKLSNSVESVSKEGIPDECFPVQGIRTADGNYCFQCYQHIQDFIHKPLHWTNFQLLQEWFLTVPIQMQEILASSFFNSKRLRKTDPHNIENYLVNKITRLFQLHETGLNILNKNYTGSLQLMNTEELVINYHLVKTVFDITSQSGTSQSLKTAERWLQKEADPDKVYYNAYIKKHPLTYMSTEDDKPREHTIAMKDCHTILFMDNLVRLRTHEDPDPGENRTSQICTLPITLKGLPIDSDITKLWHSNDCDNDLNCNCFNSSALSKQHLHLLLNMTDEESAMMYKLKSQLNWASSLHSENLIAQMLFQSPILETTDTNEHDFGDINDLDLDELNKSMQSFTIEEPHEHDLIENMVDFEELDLEEVSDSDVEDAIASEINFIEGIERLDLTIDDDVETPTFFDDDLDLPSDTDDLSVSIVVPPDSIEIDKDIMTSDEYISCEITQFQVPPLLCRHPEPATGRDDDLTNLKQILYDVLVKLGRLPGVNRSDRILFAPDHKIAKNLIKLIKEDKYFQQFLPEFPVLHLRKSKITNLISAYKNAGILHLLKYMKDEEDTQEWTKLLTMSNIDSATRYIRRLSAALHLALLMQFYCTLTKKQQESFLYSYSLGCMDTLAKEWGGSLKEFIEEGCSKNPVFCLHVDIAKHCDEIVAISVAERVGGKDGYSLLLAAVKSCLPFSFLNGATSYASFCVELLHAHYSAGTFHQRLKETLFSTPHKDSKVNLALDTQREMDHRDALKGFRPRSTMESVIPRMSLVDHFSGVEGVRSRLLNKNRENQSENSKSESRLQDSENNLEDSESRTHKIDSRLEQTDSSILKNRNWFASINTSTKSGSSFQGEGNEVKKLQIELSEKDLKFIVPVSKLIIRMGALSLDTFGDVRNIYDPQSSSLPDAILEKYSISAGDYLIKKYVCQEELFGFKKEECPDLSSVDCIKEVKSKLKSSKGTTIRISTIKKIIPKSKAEESEKKRKSLVKKQQNVVDCMSSNMNTCQALVKPDCSKSGLQKSTGIKKALMKALWYTFEDIQLQDVEEKLNSLGLLCSDIKNIQPDISKNIKFAVFEFAGVKFQAPVSSGKDYLAYVANAVVGKAMRLFPSIRHMIVCEEKYGFTPDDLKAETRAKRQKIQIFQLLI